MMGVAAMPPSGPRLVRVMVEPDKLLPAGAAVAGGLADPQQSRARSPKGRGSRHGATTGTIRPFGVWVAMPIWTAA